MSRYDAKEWTAGRIIGVGLFAVCIGALTYRWSDGNPILAVFIGIIAAVVACIFTDPNMYKSDIELRSITLPRRPFHNDDELRPLPVRATNRCRCKCGCRHCG